eukprot:CAMPEP_0203786334 /NCGR_PEP_ID=MMETSP0100_2-20121128/1564_1 /ASSEMBLY_ACC=CAM_ASM_000210 /TAXON_ID=96639 /ORGANISM=" , Strain NY0313808BC1" /LENGTH=575 /DNA_ID=CAMNT_0050688615 /DNA_START=266 /DNA_END=1993 /DNA_ORIENTATION=-
MTEHEIETNFHGVNYVLGWKRDDNEIVFELEDDDGGKRWESCFDAKYLEDITRKTGNFKHFGVFCKMLDAALLKPSETVFADILTVQDLEMLKHRNKSFSSQHSTSQRSRSSAKRYLILTYVAKYDRVHYPIPLSPCIEPSIDMLERTISRLRQKIKREPSIGDNLFKGENDAVEELERENERLREIIRKNKALKTKSKAVSEMSHQLQQKLEQEREKWLAEREELYEEIDFLKNELDNDDQMNRENSREIENRMNQTDKQNRILRDKVASLEKALQGAKESHKRVQERRRKELEEATKELNRLRLSNKQLRVQARGSTAAVVGTGGVRGRPRTKLPPRGRATGKDGSLGRKTGRSVGGPASGAKRGSSPRFDPTAYQRERQEKLRIAAARRKRPSLSRSPAKGVATRRTGRDLNSSGASRLSASRRTRSISAGYASGDSARSRGSRVSQGSRGSRGSKGSRTSRGSQRSAGSKRSSGSVGRVKKKAPPRGAQARSTNHNPRQSAVRPPVPPSRAKPLKGDSSIHEDSASLALKTSTTTSSVMDGADIEDIDRRLAQLQSFLKQEKEKSSTTLNN